MPASRWRVRTRTLPTAQRPLVMGIVNVTPDSFSDGGRWFAAGRADPDAAVEHGRRLRAAGADILDVGGESTRPGAAPVPLAEELDRVVPVVARLAALGAVVSVDTSKAAVAAAALEAGAEIVNDVTALAGPGMAELVAASGAGVVLMHMRGEPETMQDDPRYEDVVAEVKDYLLARADAARAVGVDRDRICLDPGIGFGKRVVDNLALLARLDELVATGYPVLIGASRKSFLGVVVGEPDADPTTREHATSATTALAVAAGAAVIRVHDARAAAQAARTAAAIVRLLPD